MFVRIAVFSKDKVAIQIVHGKLVSFDVSLSKEGLFRALEVS
jgi:hypothetical protein